MCHTELTTEQSHDLFGEFVAVWNAGQLPSSFYAGNVAAPLRRTTHQWSFKGGGGGTSGPAARGMTAFLDEQKDQ